MVAGDRTRGDALLLAHLGRMGRLTAPSRPTARQRLARELGDETAALLVRTLAPAVRRPRAPVPRAGSVR